MNNAILEYYQKIQNGDITVGKYIKQVYEYIIKGLENKSFFYSQKKANAAILFIETFCRHHEGELAPQLLKLELWQKAFISVLFGILDEQGNRQFREVFLVVARKNGKTLLAAAIANYCAFLDGEYGARIYFAAPKLEQAGLCYDAFYQMICKEPELNAMSKKRRTDVYIAETNSTAKPLAFNFKKSDGLNVSLCIADECSSWQGDAGLKFYEVIKSSFGARKQPILLNISTAGYVNDGVYDELMKRSTAFLNGNSKESRLLPMIYQIDDVEKWNDINELQKSNPNLNVSTTVDYLLEEIAIAEGSLSKKSEFICKYCNIKQNSSQAWLNAQDIEKVFGDELHLEDFAHHYCVAGIDLSRTTDLTAVCVVIEKNGKLNVFTKFYMPAEKLEEAIARDGIPYNIYVQKGFLTLSGDNFVDYMDAYNFIVKDLIKNYKIYPLKVGYDRYCASYLIQDLQKAGVHCDDVFQGYNLTPVINQFSGELKDGKYNFGNNDLMKLHLLSSALKTDNELNKVKLVKLSSHEHIDGTAALLDALCVRQKWYSDIGKQLENKNK